MCQSEEEGGASRNLLKKIERKDSSPLVGNLLHILHVLELHFTTKPSI